MALFAVPADPGDAAPPGKAAPHRQAGAPQPRAPQSLPTAAYPGWEAIYADNVERIYRLMYSKVGNRPDAEDLTSQVFLTALGPMRTTASVGEVRSYLLATARTVLASHWRATLGHQVTVIDVDAFDLEDFSETGGEERSGRNTARLGAILSALPERQRAILTLRFLRGYSIKAAAAELGVTVANAKVLQHRALRRAAGLDKEGEAS
ncbi:sigma-70 family RNA polymerase sigma factor [Catenulispora yoronensis]|uniref:Sigma-70 family RNA polymerase sigma factor n=1 Tax=Catenulispora yoronensis TaxID=450799 RepID=A0ABN2V4P3_9ACTN